MFALARRRRRSVLAGAGAQRSGRGGRGGRGRSADSGAPATAPAATPAASAVSTTTPIKHVVVIIGENHTFDNVYGTYQPPPGQRIKNLLSEGIVTSAGTAGPKASIARQNTASDTKIYQLSPTRTGAYTTLPRPNTTYVSSACDGQPADTVDKRFPALANAPYQITQVRPLLRLTRSVCVERHLRVHRCLRRRPDPSLLSDVPGGRAVAATICGPGCTRPPVTATAPRRPSPFTSESTNQGALDMGYYNMAKGDAPVLKFLANHYSMSDNYHQAVMGGTGANHIMLGTGDAAFYQNANGTADATAGRRDREPQSPAGHQQLVHPGRLRQVRNHQRRQLLQLLGSLRAGGDQHPRIPAQPSV